MKELFNELTRINEVLAEIENTKKNIYDMPYYKIFGSESERQRDLSIAQENAKTYLAKKYNVLEKIQIECEKAKYLVSANQRKLIA